MAISVQTLFLKVGDTIAKDNAGDFNNDEFNRILTVVQNDAMNYFLAREGAEQGFHDALRPFLKTYETALASTVALPADYRSKRNARVGVMMMSGDVPEKKWFPANMLETDEDFDALYSPIRQPKVATEVYSYSMDSTGIRIYPQGLSGTFQMTYVKEPTVAVRGVTVDTTNEIEVYDVGTTTNLEWDSDQFNMFHDLICFYMGINVRESEVIAWLSQRKLKDQ